MFLMIHKISYPFSLTRLDPFFPQKFGLSRLNPIFFRKFELSQLNPIFFQNPGWAGLTRRFPTAQNCSKIPKQPFFQVWVELAQLGFLTSGLSMAWTGLAWTGPVHWLNSKNVKKSGFWGTVHMVSGWLRVARGGSGAKAPPLAARPKVRVSTGERVSSEKLAGWGGSFLMVDRNNAGRLGAGFISVCVETRWLGHSGGFYVPEPPCTPLRLVT